jgi:tripartite-type tricarboxylate transporter receptor subunit TctC
METQATTPARISPQSGSSPRSQQILVVHPSLPVRNVKDLLALARKEPGKITYATAGIGSGSHISTELFTSMADVKLTHVPYRGSGPAQGDLVAGHVLTAITTVPPAIAQIRGGSCARSQSPATSACRSFPTCRPSPNRACPATWR